jgi:tetratricopeptide (TPR) repeat protein
MWQGDFAGARKIVDEAQQAADRLALPRIKASSQLVGLLSGLHSGEMGEGSESQLRIAHELIPLLERESAHGELATAWRFIVIVHGVAGRYQLASDAAERSIAHAKLSGNAGLITRISGIVANLALLGPTPVLQAITQCEQLLDSGLNDRQDECNVIGMLAQLRAMNGQPQAARSLYRRARATLRDLGQGVNAAASGLCVAEVELLGGDLALAEREIRADYEFLTRNGETYYRSTLALLLSRIIRDQGRDDEALALSVVAEESAAADDLLSQALWRAVRAPILARAGRLEEAESMARAAVELSRRTEAPGYQADTLVELANVLHLAGKASEAGQSIAEGIALYLAKGNLVAAGQAQAWALGVKLLPERGLSGQ